MTVGRRAVTKSRTSPRASAKRARRAPSPAATSASRSITATIDVQGTPRAELLAPRPPLHDAALQLVIDQYGPVLDRGTVLTSDAVTEPTLLVGVLNEVRDSTGQTVSKRFGYSVVGADGIVREAGPAPYLDYAPADEPRRVTGTSLPWLTQREKDAVSWVIAEQLPCVCRRRDNPPHAGVRARSASALPPA